MTNRRIAALFALASIGALVAASAPSQAAAAPWAFTTVRLEGADGGTEPRIVVAPDKTVYAITNAGAGAVVYSSHDKGRTFADIGPIAGQDQPTIDVDIVATPGGRLVASELDFGGINFRNSYSDDGGESWTASSGLSMLADTDRQWFAVGPEDPTTGKNRIYMLWHNLASGFAVHNMYVQTSTDGGETFGPPVPTTLPGDQAYIDLQCADSSGPSGIVTSMETGQVYVLFGTRTSSIGGGCLASVDPGPVAVNIVPPTRMWVATSPDGAAGTWTQSLAIDHVDTGQVVGTQLATIDLDSAGNLYVGYTESKDAFDFTSSLNYVHADPDMASWSEPVEVLPRADAGNILPHVIAGDPGRLAFAYFHGTQKGDGPPLWYSMAAQVTDGLTAKPTVQVTQLSKVPTYDGTAAQLMGQCADPTNPVAGVENGFLCNRSTDVYGVTMDERGYFFVVWPSVGNSGDGAESGTWVSSQLSGPSLLAAGSTVAPPVIGPAPAPKPVPKPVPRPLPATGAPYALAVVGALAAAGALVLRRRRQA